MRSLGGVLALGGVLLLAGCGQGGGGDDAGSPAEPGTGSAAGTAITIEVSTDEGADVRELTLECDPTGGDHPQAQEACDALAAAGSDVFEPVPADQVCTMIYGGPQTAVVQGTVDGVEVDATFTRENGCEVDRWERLGTTFFDVPLQ